MISIENASIEDCMVVKCICNAVTKRAAKLTAAGKFLIPMCQRQDILKSYFVIKDLRLY